ncbi:MAG TPA: SPOR domain-containing protein [Syntrophales bacterium]|nr:SPOR domain-containing protein [Syntrophales bacterium]
MKETEKQEQSLFGELESIYERVAEEGVGSADDPVPADRGRRPGKRRSGIAAAEDAGKMKAWVARLWIPAAVFAAVLSLFAWFIWPTPYDYKSIKDGSRIYLVKTNRITGSMKYFHAGRWMDRPLPASKEPAAIRTAERRDEPSAGAAPERAEEASVRRAIEKLAAPAPVKPTPKKAESRRDGPYFVQVKAFRDKKEMDGFLAANTGIPDLHWKKVQIPGKGTWFRVFSGSFAGADEAAAHLRKTEMDKQFPGSFVQKQAVQ